MVKKAHNLLHHTYPCMFLEKFSVDTKWYRLLNVICYFCVNSKKVKYFFYVSFSENIFHKFHLVVLNQDQDLVLVHPIHP